MTSADAEFGPSWYAARQGEPPELRVLSGPLDVDVCIIGGGFAGLAMAEALARRGWLVALLEPGRIGAAAAETTGLVIPGYGEPVERIIDRVGIENAQAMWRLTAEAVAHLRGGAGIAAESPRPAGEGYLAVARADRDQAMRRRADLLTSAFSERAEFWPADRVRQSLKSRRLYQALHFPGAFHVDPLACALGLAASARAAGARLYEHTPVTAIDLGHVRRRVVTPHGTLRSRHIVLALPGDAAALHPPLAGMVITLAAPMAVTAPLGERARSAIRFTGAVSTEGVSASHRLLADGRLLWSGGLSTRRTPPWRFQRRLHEEIADLYPDLGDTPVEAAWLAHADYAVHRLPQVGEIQPGLWLAAAFGHHGIAAGVMAGRLLARAIDRSDDRWRLFNAYGLVPTGGTIGRFFVAAALQVKRLRRSLADSLAPESSLLLPEDTQRPGMRIPRRLSEAEIAAMMERAKAAAPPSLPKPPRRPVQKRLRQKTPQKPSLPRPTLSEPTPPKPAAARPKADAVSAAPAPKAIPKLVPWAAASRRRPGNKPTKTTTIDAPATVPATIVPEDIAPAEPNPTDRPMAGEAREDATAAAGEPAAAAPTPEAEVSGSRDAT